MKQTVCCSLSLCAALCVGVLVQVAVVVPTARGEGEWEITPESEQALKRGIDWLAQNQGPEGNWTSNDLGLVSMGALAFLSAGHRPGIGPYGQPTRRALDYVIGNVKPSGLLNISNPRRGMYNHGLSTFVLAQAYGMSNDERIGPVLDRALKLIVQTQCGDGGWDYHARPQAHGHDLSLAVMQAKALRSAVDSGLEVPPEAIELAIRTTRPRVVPVTPRKRSNKSIRGSSLIRRAVAVARLPWPLRGWSVCRNSPNTTTGVSKRTWR